MKNFDVAFGDFCKRYPELKDIARRSMLAPQFGHYHNEGPTLREHLSWMVTAAKGAASGTVIASFSKSSPQAAEIIVRTVRQRENDIIDFIFAHDIMKIDRLALTFADSKFRKEITLKTWEKITATGMPYSYKGSTITGISYFHPSKKELSDHGKAAADLIIKRKVDMPALTVKVIAIHELIFSYTKDTKPEAYRRFVEKHELSQPEIEFFITTSYLDAAASFRSDMQPDFSRVEAFSQLHLEHAASGAHQPEVQNT